MTSFFIIAGYMFSGSLVLGLLIGPLMGGASRDQKMMIEAEKKRLSEQREVQ